MTPDGMPRREGERGGGASVEAAVLTLGIGLLILFALAVGRFTGAESATTEAARAAARLGSVQRDPAVGRTLATDEARRVLAQRGVVCAALDVTVEVPAVPVGAPSVATARVHCAVRWSDLGLPGAPGTKDVVAEFTSSIDRYRER